MTSAKHTEERTEAALIRTCILDDTALSPLPDKVGSPFPLSPVVGGGHRALCLGLVQRAFKYGPQPHENSLLPKGLLTQIRVHNPDMSDAPVNRCSVVVRLVLKETRACTSRKSTSSGPPASVFP